jgi:hypothetical protein
MPHGLTMAVARGPEGQKLTLAREIERRDTGRARHSTTSAALRQ